LSAKDASDIGELFIDELGLVTFFLDELSNRCSFVNFTAALHKTDQGQNDDKSDNDDSDDHQVVLAADAACSLDFLLHDDRPHFCDLVAVILGKQLLSALFIFIYLFSLHYNYSSSTLIGGITENIEVRFLFFGLWDHSHHFV